MGCTVHTLMTSRRMASRTHMPPQPASRLRCHRQSIDSLPKNRCTAMVPDQPPPARGTLAISWALKRSTSRMARLLCRSHPGLSFQIQHLPSPSLSFNLSLR